jgi:hypothetical protein
MCAKRSLEFVRKRDNQFLCEYALQGSLPLLLSQLKTAGGGGLLQGKEIFCVSEGYLEADARPLRSERPLSDEPGSHMIFAA